jgi:hypothetical protein
MSSPKSSVDRAPDLRSLLLPAIDTCEPVEYLSPKFFSFATFFHSAPVLVRTKGDLCQVIPWAVASGNDFLASSISLIGSYDANYGHFIRHMLSSSLEYNFLSEAQVFTLAAYLMSVEQTPWDYENLEGIITTIFGSRSLYTGIMPWGPPQETRVKPKELLTFVKGLISACGEESVYQLKIPDALNPICILNQIAEANFLKPSYPPVIYNPDGWGKTGDYVTIMITQALAAMERGAYWARFPFTDVLERQVRRAYKGFDEELPYRPLLNSPLDLINPAHSHFVKYDDTSETSMKPHFAATLQFLAEELFAERTYERCMLEDGSLLLHFFPFDDVLYSLGYVQLKGLIQEIPSDKDLRTHATLLSTDCALCLYHKEKTPILQHSYSYAAKPSSAPSFFGKRDVLVWVKEGVLSPQRALGHYITNVATGKIIPICGLHSKGEDVEVSALGMYPYPNKRGHTHNQITIASTKIEHSVSTPVFAAYQRSKKSVVIMAPHVSETLRIFIADVTAFIRCGGINFKPTIVDISEIPRKVCAEVTARILIGHQLFMAQPEFMKKFVSVKIPTDLKAHVLWGTYIMLIVDHYFSMDRKKYSDAIITSTKAYPRDRFLHPLVTEAKFWEMPQGVYSCQVADGFVSKVRE